MRNKCRIIVAALVIITSVCVDVFYSRPPPGPIYKGKPLSYWLQGFLPPANSKAGSPTKDEAASALQETGTNAIPTLLRMLQAQDWAPEAAFFSWIDRRPELRKFDRHTPSWEKNYEAFDALRSWGVRGAPAVPGLTGIYDHGSWVCRQCVLSALGGIGPPASNGIPLLLCALTNKNPVLRFDAAYALGAIHRQPTLAVPALIRTLKDRDPGVRANAAAALGGFNEDAQSVVPALLELRSSEKTNSTSISAAAFMGGGSLIVWNSRAATNSAIAFGGPVSVSLSVEKALSQIDPSGKFREKLHQ